MDKSGRYAKKKMNRSRWHLFSILAIIVALLVGSYMVLNSFKVDQQQTETVLPIRRIPNSNPPTDLFIAISGPPTVVGGSAVEYSLTFGNNGPVSASNVFVDLSLPSMVEFESDTIAGTPEATPYGRLWNLGSIESGTQQTATLTLSMPSSVPVETVLSINIAIESSTVPDAIFDNNKATETTKVLPVE